MIKKIMIVIKDEENIVIECSVSKSVLEKIKTKDGSYHLVHISKELT